MPAFSRRSAGLEGQRHLGAGGDEHDVGVAGRRVDRARRRPWPTPVALACSVRSTTGRFWRDRARPAGRPRRRISAHACGGLVGVGRAHHGQARHRAQGGEVLDRLVGRAVLAEADRVVRPDEGDRQLLDGGEAHRGAHVVGEDEEGAAVGAGQALERDAVEDHAHGVLADAEVQGAAVGAALPLVGLLALGDERGLAGHRRVVGLGEVGRAAPQLGQRRRRARRAPCRMPRGSPGPWRRPGTPGSAFSKPSGRRASTRRSSRAARSALALRHAAYRLFHAWWAALPRFLTSRVWASTAAVDLEGLRRVEAEQLLGGGDLVGAERRAVRLAGAAGRRGRPGDDGVQRDEGGLGARLLALLEGGEQRVDVLGVVGGAGRVGRAAPVDVDDVPAVGLVALGDVLAERDVGVVLDRDLVGVVDDGEVAELLVAGERGRLGGNALHQVAVGGEHPDVVVEDALAGLGVGVEQAALAALGHRHADGGGQARSRAGRW